MQTEIRYVELFRDFDKDPFPVVSEQELGHKILALTPDPVHATELEKAELFAFRFLENYHSKESSFYTPQIRQALATGGERVFPDIAEVTKPMMEYWVHRAKSTTHPVLQARYAGLVHEFHLQVCNTSVHYAMSILFAKALHETVKQELIEIFAYKAGKLEKALSIAVQMNEKKLIEAVKESILRLDEEVSITEIKNHWVYSFDIFFAAQPKLLTIEEWQQLIERLEKRLDHHLTVELEAAWEAGKRLCNYYQSKQDKQNVLRVLTKIESTLLAYIETQPLFQKLHWIERLYQSFEKYGFRTQATHYLTLIRETSQKTDGEMKSIGGSTTLSQESIDNVINKVLLLEGESLLTKIASDFLLNEEKIKEEVAVLAQEHPLFFQISKDIVDAKGRKVGILPPYSENSALHVIRQAEFSIKINAILLRFIVDEGIKRGIVDKLPIMSYLKLSPVFGSANIAILDKAITYYLTKDFVGFIHVVIPQIEEAIRNLIEKNGGNVLVHKDGIYLLKTLDHLLCDPVALQKLGSSACFHFRSLLSDKTGMNLRNDLAHGYINPEKFNIQIADALFTALLILIQKTKG